MRALNKLLPALKAWLLLPLLLACTPSGNKGTGEVLVRVYDKYLYASDLKGIVPPGTSVRDSLTLVRTFIQNWVDKELLARKAEENLPEGEKDFSLQLEEYRNSLIIFEYEKMLVRQELDTVVSHAALEDYYRQNKASFILQEDVMRMDYLVLHADSPEYWRFRRYMRTDDTGERDSLIMYASRYAEKLNLMDEGWVKQDEMSESIPLERYSYNDYLANRRYFEVRDSSFIYMVNFRDYKPADSLSPLILVQDKIRKIIINKRKNELIRDMRQRVLHDAIEHNQVEIF